MIFRHITLFVLLALYTPWACFAQGVSDFYRQSYPSKSGIGFRSGLNYSFPNLTAAVVQSPNATSFLGGVVPRYGYYIGGFLYKDLSPTQLTFRLDATLQMKGVGGIYMNKIVHRARYYYAGISPMIGVNLTNKLTIYTGVEANLLIANQNPWGKTYPFELGTSLRLTYNFGLFRTEIGYSRGFNKFDRFELNNLPGGPVRNDFFNQNIQVGVLYNWTR